MVPLVPDRSEWQTPTAPIFTITSPRPGESNATSSTTTGLPSSRATTALPLRAMGEASFKADRRATGSRRIILPARSPSAPPRSSHSSHSRGSTMLLRDQLYINGQWAAPSTKETIDVHSAGTGEVMGTVPAGGEQDIDAAVRAARGA